MCSLKAITLVILITTSFQDDTSGAEPQAAWFSLIQENFDNATFPLHSCSKRMNMAPPSGSLCGFGSKTCFFGDQACQGGIPYPAESCTCDGRHKHSRGTWSCQPEGCPIASECVDAVTTERLWFDIRGLDCDDYERAGCWCEDDGDFYENFNLTANQACCSCGGGTVDASTSLCVDAFVALDNPRPWLDSSLENCTFYTEDPVTRCTGFASERDSISNLTVGEACCACRDVVIPANTTCVDLSNWTTNDGRTCGDLLNRDCRAPDSESFGITAGEACCKCGSRANNANAIMFLNPPALPVTAGSCTSDSSRFNMCIKVARNVALQDVSAIHAAALRWSSVIVEDIPDFLDNFDVINTVHGFGGEIVSQMLRSPGLAWFQKRVCHFDPGFPANATDDVNVCVAQLELAPPFLLAQATPVFGDSFARFGSIEINSLQIRKLRINVTLLTDVITHELGHILGIGTLWNSPSTGRLNVNITDCSYIGPNANRVYQGLSGCPAGTTAPLQDPSRTHCRGSGHLNEECFMMEIMTPGFKFTNLTSPLSVLTIAMLDDLGYTVDYSQADPFNTSDLHPSCLCGGDDDDGEGPSFSRKLRRRPNGDLDQRMTIASATTSKIRSDAIAHAEGKLKNITEMATSFMSDREEDAVLIEVPGISVLYMEEDGTVQSVFVPNRQQ